MRQAHILVVDDDRNLLELLTMRLETMGHMVTSVSCGQDAIDAVARAQFDLAVIDLQLPDSDGISLMEEIKSIHPMTPALILTAHGSIESAVEAVKRGAFNYLTKPFDAGHLQVQVERALENRRLVSELKRLKGLLRETDYVHGIVAKSKGMRAVLEQVSLVAGTDSTVFIHGESGTGKELVARAIHSESSRREMPFVAINCAAIPDTLLESELFGFVKGAFTGATRSAQGLFAQAHRGTMFLDEVADMSLSVQAKLLRVFQERQFFPLGSETPRGVDVRVIVATNKDLESEVRAGRFREDLYYRIYVIPIELPSLRERKEDIPLLVAHFLKKVSRRMDKVVEGIAPEAMQRLMRHDWPGNVRELENTIEYAVAMTSRPVISEELVLQDFPLKVKDAEPPVPPLKEARDSFERRYLEEALRAAAGNVSRAARIAGKYRADFYNLLKKYDIKPDIFKRS